MLYIFTLEEIQDIIKPNYSESDIFLSARKILGMAPKEFDTYLLKGINSFSNLVSSNYERYENWHTTGELAYEVKTNNNGVTSTEFAEKRAISFLYRSKALAGDIQVVLAWSYAKSSYNRFFADNIGSPQNDLLDQLLKDYIKLYNSHFNKNREVANIQSILNYVARILGCSEETFDELALRCLIVSMNGKHKYF